MTDDEDPKPATTAGRGQAFGFAIATTLAAAMAMAFAFAPERAGQKIVFLLIGAAYLPFLIRLVVRLKRDGELTSRFRFSSGDAAFGLMITVAMVLPGILLRASVLEAGTPRGGWLTRVFLQIGDPFGNSVLLGAVVVVVALLEEAVWRGGVLFELEEHLGSTRALVATSVLYAAAHLPSTWLLADGVAGPNPLLVGAALVGGLVWGLIALRTRRMGLSMCAHAFFYWAIVQLPFFR